MTQKKYVVTEYKLQNLFDAGTRNALTTFSGSMAKRSSYYRECLKEPYVEPELEGWRKHWEPVSAAYNQILFVSEPDRSGKIISIQKTEAGDLTHFYHQHPGEDHERGYRWALIKKEPEVVKVEAWMIISKVGKANTTLTYEAPAPTEYMRDDIKIVKLEGSYTK